MEEGYQKYKRLSYMAKFKYENVRCAEEKRIHKAAAIFGADESNVRLWQKHSMRHRQRNLLDPRMDNLLK
jgi:hypothetical protein